eukprot:TRINITY_DN8266_c0_g1_i1.p1 TRINITY_DN8266_c0_g1~~TRINITY_DN8266_c0_g1_i1.p1  ORF type:complete len:192 (+),score=36.44 TRINITY_DN8266_c0_g1_i1:488-1063(+)
MGTGISSTLYGHGRGSKDSVIASQLPTSNQPDASLLLKPPEAIYKGDTDGERLALLKLHAEEFAHVIWRQCQGELRVDVPRPAVLTKIHERENSQSTVERDSCGNVLRYSDDEMNSMQGFVEKSKALSGPMNTTGSAHQNPQDQSPERFNQDSSFLLLSASEYWKHRTSLHRLPSIPDADAVTIPHEGKVS